MGRLLERERLLSAGFNPTLTTPTTQTRNKMKSKTRTWDALKRELHTQEEINILQEQAQVELIVEKLIAQDLGELRRFTNKTQTDVALEKGVKQPQISKLESQSINSMLLSTLRAYVEALGGTIEIHAKFGNRSVSLIPSE